MVSLKESLYFYEFLNFPQEFEDNMIKEEETVINKLFQTKSKSEEISDNDNDLFDYDEFALSKK